MANNNYDRMLLGESQQPTSIPNKAKLQRKRKKNKTKNIFLIELLVAAVVLGLITLGAAGSAAQGFMLGIFGWLGVGYALAVVITCAFFLSRAKKPRNLPKSKKWLAAGLGVMLFIVVLFSHLWTSYAAYDNVLLTKGSVSYGDYLGYVYHHGSSTSGGALLSIIAYPFLNAIGLRLSGILLAVLFFVVLFAMIYPFWLTTKEKRVIRDDETVGEEADLETPRLFVETVEGGDAHAAKARGKKRRENFDFSFPNGNDPTQDGQPDELDMIDDEEMASHTAVDTAEARKQNALDLLLDMKHESTQVQRDKGGYDPSKDSEHPLQFGDRQTTHVDWARPIDSVPREQLPEKERKQQSYDILFGEKPAPKSFAAYTPQPVKPQPKPQGLAAGDTIETVVPSKRDMNNADMQRQSRIQNETRRADSNEQGQTVYKIPDNGSYVNRRNPPEVKPQQSEQQADRWLDLTGDKAQTPIANETVFPKEQTPIRETPTPETRASQSAPVHDNAWRPAEPKVRESAAAPSEERQSAMPKWGEQAREKREQPTERAPYAPPVAPQNAPSTASVYASRPLRPEEAGLVAPKEYPTYQEEESDLDKALHHVQDDYVEEPAAPVDRNGFVERAEAEAVPPAFGGFVKREIKEEPATEPTPAVEMKPKEKEVKPRFTAVPNEKTRQEARAFQPDPEVKKVRPYTAPPLYLLKDYPPPEDTEDYNAVSQNLEEAFASYGVNVNVIGYTRGPTYTQFAVKLGEGIQFKRVSTLGQDIVRKMCLSEEINIVPKVPNMDAIGVEIINKTRSRVGLKPLLTSNKFRQDKKLYFVLGVDVMGQPYYCDILSGPHMLIAGSSGSGKSVCLNTLICSILFNYKPDYVKFILIDPKGGVEMGVYNDLPHNLLGKAAVTPANTIKALDWAIEEMERRYALMRDLNVRSWGDYNDKLLAGNMPRQPYILIIIDELADLMASSKKNAADIEVRIARLTAKARASGIHVIVATQRPSVDVITGTIKNNIPTRVAFKTATQIDSKTILEKGCAEKLYGKGDMYFMSSEFNELKRLQGPFLTDDEVNIICDNIRANNDCVVDEVAANSIFKEDAQEERNDVSSYEDVDEDENGEMGEEDLFERAVRAAAEQGYVSISRLQRVFRLGFNRAALLVDEMEAREFIEKPVMGSSKPRRVLITPAECDDIFGYHDDEDE